MEKVAQLPLFVYIYFLHSQPLTEIAINNKYDPPIVGLRLELKSDLGLEKVGDHCFTL